MVWSIANNQRPVLMVKAIYVILQIDDCHTSASRLPIKNVLPHDTMYTYI